MENNSGKKFIITGAQASYNVNSRGEFCKWGNHGDPAILNEKLYQGFKRFGEEHGAELLINQIQGCSLRENVLHASVRHLEELHDWERRFEKLNLNITLSDIHVPPQNVDPSTSRKHLPSKYRSSLLYPGSKQRLCPVPSHKSDFPRFLATTGCITMPNFNRTNDRGDQAWRDHRMGGILVEIHSNNIYTMRFLTAQRNGKFIDLGQEYDGGKKSKKRTVDALVLGDYHFGEHDKKTFKANYEMIETLNPKKVVLHDIVSLPCVAHWDFNKPILRAQKFARGQMVLEESLEGAYKEILNLSKRVGKKAGVHIVHSNHDDFLSRYMDEGIWRKRDLWNASFCSKLESRLINRAVPEDEYLKEAISFFGPLPGNVHFLSLRDNLSVRGYELSVHGHLGKNGSRCMSVKTMDETIGKGVIGHKHAPEQYRDSYVVGTSSRTDLRYMHGSASAAMPANLAIYSNGKAQMLPIINGRWRMD